MTKFVSVFLDRNIANYIHWRTKCFRQNFFELYASGLLDTFTHIHKIGCKCTVFNTLRTGDADLRLYITTVQDG